jgi:hypothetical protein
LPGKSLGLLQECPVVGKPLFDFLVVDGTVIYRFLIQLHQVGIHSIRVVVDADIQMSILPYRISEAGVVENFEKPPGERSFIMIFDQYARFFVLDLHSYSGIVIERNDREFCILSFTDDVAEGFGKGSIEEIIRLSKQAWGCLKIDFAQKVNIGTSVIPGKNPEAVLEWAVPPYEKMKVLVCRIDISGKRSYKKFDIFGRAQPTKSQQSVPSGNTKFLKNL